MKKTTIIIGVIVLVIIIAGLAIALNSKKECPELNEQQCKKDDRCLSVLVPCTADDCPNAAIFRECKSK